MKKLELKDIQELNGGYFGPSGTVLNHRDNEIMRKYGAHNAIDFFRGVWAGISEMWN